MKIKLTLTYALTGWVAGFLTTIVVGLCWPTIFPAIVRIEHYYGAGPGLPIIIGLVALYASPAALIGGMVGGWVPKEGGRNDEYILAAIFGVLLATPIICYGLWFFTGW
ncbi:MAG: hypothetical protein WCK35_02670 [Chloroflexota bacterium]